MTTRPATRRLAARAVAARVRALAASAAAQAAADRLARACVARILRAAESLHPWDVHRLTHVARAELAALGEQVATLIGTTAERQYRTARDRAGRDVAAELPHAVVRESLLEARPVVKVGTRGRPTILPAPSPAAVQRVVYSSGWPARLARETGLAAPADVARVVSRGMVGGRSIRDIAGDLSPVVQGVGATARRIARDEVQRVSNEAQWEAWAEIDDMIAGYQIHAVLDSRTRPEHRARDGTVYWKTPKPGQKGLDEMPRPPMEASGKTAFGCRCVLSPVWDEPSYNDPHARHGPDPDVMDRWFQRAPQREKRLAVGHRAYNAVAGALKDQGAERAPSWFDFVNDSGVVMDIKGILRKLASVLGLTGADS